MVISIASTERYDTESSNTHNFVIFLSLASSIGFAGVIHPKILAIIFVVFFFFFNMVAWLFR